MGTMSKEDGDAIKNWITLCLDLNFTAAWDLDLFGLVTLTSEYHHFLLFLATHDRNGVLG
jgi:hypothetical protein